MSDALVMNTRGRHVLRTRRSNNICGQWACKVDLVILDNKQRDSRPFGQSISALAARQQRL